MTNRYVVIDMEKLEVGLRRQIAEQCANKGESFSIEMHDYWRCNGPDEYKEELVALSEAIQAMKAPDDMQMGWLPVSSWKGQPGICYSKENGVIMWMDGPMQSIDGVMQLVDRHEISHWRPFPLPPQEGE